MIEFVAGFAVGLGSIVAIQVLSPKVSDVIGNIHRSRALTSAKALIAAEEARVVALAKAKELVAANTVQPPPAPPNPVAPAA